MRRHLLISVAFSLIALGATAGANAQTAGDGTAVLPVWNNASGKLEAYLVLEPTDVAQTGTRWKFGSNSLDAAFGLESGDSLALLCNRKNGLAGAIGNLANNCMLATLGEDLGGDSRRSSATAAFNRGGGRLGVTAGSGRDTLPGWMTPGAAPNNNKIDINDLTVFGQKSLPREGFVSIAGTVAKARLLSPAAAEASGLASDRWTSKSLSVGGGFGAFGASIVGHVIDTPGQPKWEGLGLGLTWRTPWSGELTVGADNVISRGKNPFAPAGAEGKEDEGTVPYVRYEQEL